MKRIKEEGFTIQLLLSSPLFTVSGFKLIPPSFEVKNLNTYPEESAEGEPVKVIFNVINLKLEVKGYTAVI